MILTSQKFITLVLEIKLKIELDWKQTKIKMTNVQLNAIYYLYYAEKIK